MIDSEREESILRSLRRILRAVALHSRQLQRQHALTAPQLICLRFLRDRDEPPTAGELARGMSLSQATVTGLLDRLERRGLVERQRGTRDRRRVRALLTEAGRRVSWDAPSPLHERFAQRLALLPDNAARQIDEVLADVVQMMEAEDLDAAPVLSPEAAFSEAPAPADTDRSDLGRSEREPAGHAHPADPNPRPDEHS